MSFCDKCGKPLPKDGQFCIYCGAEVSTGIETVPGNSPFHPAADLDSQPASILQPGNNDFYFPGDIGSSEVRSEKPCPPSRQPEPEAPPKTETSASSAPCEEKTAANLRTERSAAPAEKKSHKKRILTISAVGIAVAVCVAVALIFLLSKSGDTALSDDPIKLNDEVTSLVESYTDENGYVSIEECAEVAGIVRDYAEKLKQSHEIQDYAFDEKSGSVSFRFSNNTIYVYSPPLQDVLENGNEFSVMSISSFDGVIETAYSILDKPIHGTLGGPHQAAEYIHDNCPQCTQIDKITKSHCGPGELQEKLMTIGETNTRAIFFLGHGGLLPLESGDIWSIFAVGEDPTEKNNGKYCDMLAANEIVWRNSSDSYTGLCYAITPEFVKHYMAEVNGGLFFAGACHSAEDDGSMSNAFINKGFDCYIGYDNSVTTTYGTSIMKYIAIYLSENNNGEFTDIHTALEKAKQECGETDANGTRCLCIDKDNKNPFRLSGGQKTAPEPTEQVIIDSDSGGAWEDDSHGARTDSGTCGEQVKWELFEDGTLHIYGSGAMYLYSNPPEIPWFDFNQKVQSLQIDTGVTAINGFYSCDSLTCVEISNSVTAIYDGAFKWCTSLTSVTIPDSVKTIGDCAFAGCSLIKKIVFRGDAPAFSDNCFSSVTATAYFPAGNATWTSAVMQNYGGSLTWVSYTGNAETTEPSTSQPEASESVGNVTGMSYEEARNIYLDYFRSIDLESLRVSFLPYTDETVQVFDFEYCSKEDYKIQSMLADIGNDGSYELLLIVGNPKLTGPAGYPVCSLLFAIHDGKVEQVLDSYFSGGTAGGGNLSVVFDTVTERHLIATESHGRDGMSYGISTFTVFDCIDQRYTEAEVLTSEGINLDDQFYQEEAEKIRGENPYAMEEDGYLKYFRWNDAYISKSVYEEQCNRYVAPTDDRYNLKDASLENLIP